LKPEAHTLALNPDWDGCFHSFSRSVFKWKTYRIQQWEYSSKPSSDASGTRVVLKTKHALASGTSNGCLGVPFLVEKQEWTTPIGIMG